MKTKLRLLSASIAITSILLISCFIYFWFNLNPGTLNLFRIIILIVFFILLAEIFCWIRIEMKKSRKKSDKLLENCDELVKQQRRMIVELAVALKCFHVDESE